MWHKPILECGISIQPTIMGCGHMQVRGLSSLLLYESSYQKFKKDFNEKIVPLLLVNGGYDNLPCKTLLYVEGTSRYGGLYKDNLLDLGFREIARYPNAAHPRMNDTQILFMLNLE